MYKYAAVSHGARKYRPAWGGLLRYFIYEIRLGQIISIIVAELGNYHPRINRDDA